MEQREKDRQAEKEDTADHPHVQTTTQRRNPQLVLLRRQSIS